MLPGLNDAHVHFPTWSLAQRQVRLEGARSLAEAVPGNVRRRRAARRPARRPGCAAWAGATPTGPRRRRGPRWTRVVPDTPATPTSKDYHSLWLNSAALARARGDLDAPGGVVERDASGEPLGVLRENAAWRFPLLPCAGCPRAPSRLPRGLPMAAARGVTAIHDKDGRRGALELFQRLRADGELTLRVWQSIPADRLARLRELGLRSGFGDELLRPAT